MNLPQSICWGAVVNSNDVLVLVCEIRGIVVLAYSLIPKSKIHTSIVVRRGRVVGVKMQVRCVQCVNSDPYYVVGPLNTHSHAIAEGSQRIFLWYHSRSLEPCYLLQDPRT